MALTVPIVGDVLLLQYMLNYTPQANVQMRLYNNNYTPHESSALGDFSESTATNYTAVSLTGAAWTVSSGSSAGATATYTQQSFNFSTSDTIYGYFVTSGGARELMWAERFTGGPFQLPTSGGTIAVTPKISLD